MFNHIVFAGGGNRCWWQAGFWEVVQPALNLQPISVSGVSAGAATACMVLSQPAEGVLQHYAHALQHNTRNSYWGNLFKPNVRVFPHNAIFRQALTTIFAGDNFEKLKNGPEIFIQFARLPRGMERGVLPHVAVGLGIAAYNLEKYGKGTLHPRFGRKLGFTPEVLRAQDCKNVDELVSLIIASSCTPPFTPIEYRNARPTMDGGLVDNVPVGALPASVDAHKTLVLVTRRYPHFADVFVHQNRTYVQPSHKVPISSWDYTRPHRMRVTFEQGRADGEKFLLTLKA